MGIDRSILSEFIKVTNDKNESKQVQLYGTVVTKGNSKCVKIDGSKIITPVRSTTDIKDDERVMVTIKDHMATITGNMSNPSVGNDRVELAEGKIDRFDHLFAGNITAENIAAGSITSDKILAGSITTDKLMAECIISDKIASDTIESKHIKADAIESEHIKAGSIEAEHIKAGVIDADHISSGTITADKIATGTITAGSGVIADGAIGNAQISKIDAAKIEAGTIDTSKVTVQGSNGHLRLKDNRLQVFDGIGNKAKERVSVGDVNGDGSKFGLRVRGADGETILLDEHGVTREGITDGSITNDKISSDANIDGAKLNINSVISKINEDGTETIQGTKIEVDGTTLETKLYDIKMKQDENADSISQAQTQINANTNSLKLKVDEQTYTNDKKDMTSKLDKNTSEINLMKGQIALKVEHTDIENAKSELEGVMDSKINTAKSEIKVTTDAISQNVSQLSNTVSNKADGSTVTELNKKVGSLTTSVNGIIGEVSDLQTTTTTINNKAENAQSTANTAKETANTNKNNISNIQGEVNTVKNNVASLQVTTNGISQQVSSLESTTIQLTEDIDNVQDTADNATNIANDKSKIFTSTPVTPYKVGDLWVQGTNGDMMRCIKSRATGNFTSSDWDKASKYTDDTKANEAQNIANTANNTANANKNEITNTNKKVSSIENNLNGITSRVSNVETKQISSDGKISSLETRMSTAESKITETAITNTVKKNFYTKSETDNQITSKGYQTESQVQQTVNQLEVKFSSSGGYNLIYNGNFERGLEHWTLTTAAQGYIWVKRNENGSPNNPLELFMQGVLDNENRYATQGFDWTSNEALTLSWYQWTSNGGEDGSNVYRGTQVIIGYTDGSKSWHTSGNQTELNVWQKRSMTIRPDAGKRVAWMNVEMWCRDTSKATVYTDIMLEKGEVATNWTPNPNEIYDGITTIDKDGIKVTASDTNTYTEMDASSFRVRDNNGGTVAEFAKTSTIPTLNSGTIKAQEVYANNLVTKTKTARSYYVNGVDGVDGEGRGTSWGNACRSVQYVLDNYVEDVINSDITIYVGRSVQYWNCEGRTGSATLTFQIEDDCIVSGGIGIIGCTCYVRVVGSGNKKGTLTNGIVVTGCTRFDIGWLTFRGANWASSQGSCNVLVRNGSRGTIRMCDFNGVSYGVIVDNNVEVWFYNNIGSGVSYYIGFGAYTVVNLMRSGGDTCPDYTSHFYGDAGHANLYYYRDGANFTKTPSVGWSPSYTPTQKTQTWNFNKIWSDETLHGWSDRQELIQGYASTWNTGRWTGYMQFTDGMAAIRSTISGGTNFSGRLYVQRRTSSGNSTGSKLCLYASDGTLITNSTTINRGQGVWVNLSSAIISKIASGAITYFYLKADANNTSTFFKCEANPKIEITYTK